MINHNKIKNNRIVISRIKIDKQIIYLDSIKINRIKIDKIKINNQILYMDLIKIKIIITN